MSDPIRIPAAVAKKLGNYVYLYIDPRDGKPIYVGKGRGSRVLAHLKSDKRKQLTSTIREIRRAGLEPKLEILSHNLPSEKTALQVECAVIDALYAFGLANKVRGWGSREAGRASLKELIARYTGKPFKCREPAILIRINRLYRPDMTPVELYDATRSAWKVGERRRTVKYAMAVYNGVIRRSILTFSGCPEALHSIPSGKVHLRASRTARSLWVESLRKESADASSMRMLGTDSSREARIRSLT